MAEKLEDLVMKAATSGDVTTLTQLVATHGAPAVRMAGNPNELTALHWAAASGVLEAVNYLLSPAVQADPRAARLNNFTPLHSAAMRGHATICEVLLNAGAGANVQTDPQKYAHFTARRSLVTLRRSGCCWRTKRIAR